MKSLKIKKHPRLFGPSDLTTHLQKHIRNAYIKTEADAVLVDANYLVRLKPVEWDDIEGHLYPISHQIASQIENLTGAWALTRDMRFRTAALKRVEALTGFSHIGCESHKTMPLEKGEFFCLTYGWHSVAISYLYDLLQPEISDEEDAIIMGFLEKHLMKRAKQCLTRPPWWVNTDWSNWNGVCAGGMGILALSFYDRFDVAPELVSFVDKSLSAYLGSYISNGGGCPEGTGYYNYGMQFSIPYLKCWESATGRKHPALKIKELGKSLHFPMDFHRMSFGDNDGWGPTGYQFWLANRMQEESISLKIASHLKVGDPVESKLRTKSDGANRGMLLYAAEDVPSPSKVDMFCKKKARKKTPVARVYKGMGWAALADDDVTPSLRMTVRGSTTAKAGHASRDQFSFKCGVNGECMISDQHDRPGVSFTKRGNDVYGRSAPSKSGLFIEGLGCDLSMNEDTTEIVEAKGIKGLRVHGGGTYLLRWQNAFIGRLFLLVEGKYWVIVDRQSVGANCMEARFHTFADSRHGKDWLRLKSGKERLTMSFASLDRAVMQTSPGMPTYPDQQSTIFRWITSERNNDNVLVTALNPGNSRLEISLKRENEGVVSLTIKKSGKTSRILRVSKELMLL